VSPLLRFQATALARHYANPLVYLCVAVVPVAACVAATATGLIADAWAGMAFAVAATLVVAGAAFTWDALDTVCWTSPVRRRDAALAHLAFWSLVCALPVAAWAAAHADSLTTALALFGVVMLLVAAVAFAIQALQRIWRRMSDGAFALAWLLGLAAIVPCAWAMLFAWTGRLGSAAAIAAVLFAISVVAALWALARDERLPVASGTVEEATADAPDGAGKPARAYRVSVFSTPAMSWLWVLLATGMMLLPGWAWFPNPASMCVVAVLQLAIIAGPTCRWLLPTPMDRGRMYRRVFGPVLLFAAGATAVHIAVIELQPNRTGFFRTFRDRPASSRGRNALALGQVLEVRDGHLCQPEIPFMAARVREHLWATYGLDVTQERLEASIRRGWPPEGRNANDHSPLNQEAVFDAMGRVRVDLGDDMIAADRRQHLLSASIVLLLCLVAMHPTVAPSMRGRLWTVAPTLAVLFLITLPALVPGTALAREMLAAEEATRRLFLGTSGPVAIALFAGLAALGFLLWKSGERAFRRLDLTDFPPSPMDTLRRSRTA
jgi:hypothetical protein